MMGIPMPMPVMPMDHMGMGHFSATALLAKWRRQLDQKATDSLMSLGSQAAAVILQEMEAKAGSVRNPSAYIQKACDNFMSGGGIGPGAVPSNGSFFPPAVEERGWLGHAGPGGGGCNGGGCSPLHPSLMGRFAGLLDGDALDALSKVDTAKAMIILQNLESKASTVRNPSAY